MKSWDDDIIIIGGDDDETPPAFDVGDNVPGVPNDPGDPRPIVGDDVLGVPDKPDDSPKEETPKEDGAKEDPPPRQTKKIIAAEITPATAAQDADPGLFDHHLIVSASPHIHVGEETRIIMQDVLIALTPTAIISVVYFGWRAFMLIAVCVASCVGLEYISRRMMKRPNTISDCSAAVTGLLLAFCLPPGLNPFYAVLGCVMAIVVVKQMFGGLGMNFANPAITARIALTLSFAGPMTTFFLPGKHFLSSLTVPDAVTSATPLFLQHTNGALPFEELLIGNHAGTIGETCVIALLLGGGYLVARRVITLHIPLSFFGAVALMAVIFGGNPLDQLLSGGVMLGAIFMATDYVTSPSNKKGKIIFGVGCGLITMLIRLFASLPEGVSFAILLMNILTPHIERLTAEKVRS